MTGGRAKLTAVSVARARVERADGSTDIYYSPEKVSPLDFRRWLKLRRHIRLMKREDKQWLKAR